MKLFSVLVNNRNPLFSTVKPNNLRHRNCIFLFLSLLLSLFSMAQKKQATVSGRIVDENEQPLARVSISILGKNTGISSNDSGSFHLKVPSNRPFALLFSYTGYKTEQRNFYLNEQLFHLLSGK